MSYHLQKAFGRNRDDRTHWQALDGIESETISAINEQYFDVHLQIKHDLLESSPYIVELEKIIDRFQPTETLATNLQTFDDTSLPYTQEGSMEVTTRRVKVIDPFLAGFSLKLGNQTSHPSNDWPTSHYRDVLLYKDGWALSDYQELEQYVFATINGYCHRVSASEYGLFVVDGNISRHISGRAEIQLIDFEALGAVQLVPLGSQQLVRAHEDLQFYNTTYLDLGTPLENKTVFLSLGGYFHTPGDACERVDDQYMKIQFSRIPLLQRYYDSKPWLDISDIVLTPLENNDHQNHIDEIRQSETFIEQLLDLEQSFAIVVDQAPIATEWEVVENAQINGVYLHPHEPVQPLMMQRGRLRGYSTYVDNDTYVINVDVPLLPRYQFETTDWDELITVSDHLIPSQQYSIADAQLLHMTHDKLVFTA